jgi:pimeloyl-ACP methyl ester carboxylesterase
MTQSDFVMLAAIAASCACSGQRSTDDPVDGGAWGAAGAAGAAGTGVLPIGGQAGGDEGTAGTDALPLLPADKALPMVFVHGFGGSAQQWQSQAMRYVANGYPPERIVAYEHDAVDVEATVAVAGLAEVVDRVLAEFEASKVYLIGHSRGTSVSSMYLSDGQRASKVEKYIAIDGLECPSNVPCLAPRQGSGQTHVEVCTSKESFALQYEFLLGEAPQVVDIVRQRDPVEIGGRAVDFPANTGRAGTTLTIASFEIGQDGYWGGDMNQPQVLNVPNWASSQHHVSIMFSDFPQP